MQLVSYSNIQCKKYSSIVSNSNTVKICPRFSVLQGPVLGNRISEPVDLCIFEHFSISISCPNMMLMSFLIVRSCNCSRLLSQKKIMTAVFLSDEFRNPTFSNSCATAEPHSVAIQNHPRPFHVFTESTKKIRDCANYSQLLT